MKTVKTRERLWCGILGAALCLSYSAAAQVNTTKTMTHGASTQQVQVEQAEVLLVEGNDLVVRMADGTIRHFPNVPDSAKIDVDGKELGIHDLKPGMKLQRTVTTTTTPRTVTTVQTVTGKVFHVNPPGSVILALEDGTNQQFSIPKGQKFNINGEQKDAWGLKKGMVISATKVVEAPETVVEQQKKITGSMPPPPPAPPADQPLLIAAAPLPASPAAPKELPKTGTLLPLFGFAGLLAILSSLTLKAMRNFA